MLMFIGFMIAWGRLGWCPGSNLDTLRVSCWSIRAWQHNKCQITMCQGDSISKHVGIAVVLYCVLNVLLFFAFCSLSFYVFLFAFVLSFLLFATVARFFLLFIYVLDFYL